MHANANLFLIPKFYSNPGWAKCSIKHREPGLLNRCWWKTNAQKEPRYAGGWRTEIFYVAKIAMGAKSESRQFKAFVEAEKTTRVRSLIMPRSLHRSWLSTLGNRLSEPEKGRWLRSLAAFIDSPKLIEQAENPLQLDSEIRRNTWPGKNISIWERYRGAEDFQAGTGGATDGSCQKGHRLQICSWWNSFQNCKLGKTPASNKY